MIKPWNPLMGSSFSVYRGSGGAETANHVSDVARVST
jgi:hypothetical protein